MSKQVWLITGAGPGMGDGRTALDSPVESEERCAHSEPPVLRHCRVPMHANPNWSW
jgi:hypothetical protein